MPQFNEGNINSYLVPSGSLTGSLSNSGTLTGQIAIGSGGGTTDYNDLTNKPQINSVTLSGNKTTADLNISYNDLDDKPTIPAAQVNSDWNAESGVAEILNKPTIPSALGDLSDVNTTGAFNGAVLTYNNGNWDPEISIEQPPNVEALHNFEATPALTAGQVLKMSHGAPVTEWTNGFVSYNELTDRPTIPDPQVNSDWNAVSGIAQILNKPTLATVATSGSYNDLSDKPTIPDLTVTEVTEDFTITKTSGAWNVASFNAYKSGTLIYIRVRFSGTGVSVSGGSDSFSGTIAGPYIPLYDSFGIGCAGNTLFIMQLNNNGTMKVRLINDAYTLASGVVAAISNLYFINP